MVHQALRLYDDAREVALVVVGSQVGGSLGGMQKRPWGRAVAHMAGALKNMRKMLGEAK
jgi:hypothetical protein